MSGQRFTGKPCESMWVYQRPLPVAPAGWWHPSLPWQWCPRGAGEVLEPCRRKMTVHWTCMGIKASQKMQEDDLSLQIQRDDRQWNKYSIDFLTTFVSGQRRQGVCWDSHCTLCGLCEGSLPPSKLWHAVLCGLLNWATCTSQASLKQYWMRSMTQHR